MNKLKKEYLFFKQQEPNMRTLLVTNMLYALVLPIVEIFVGAYIMRNTSDPVMVAFYQLAMYIGIITTSLVNGYLLKKYSVKTRVFLLFYYLHRCSFNYRRIYQPDRWKRSFRIPLQYQYLLLCSYDGSSSHYRYRLHDTVER